MIALSPGHYAESQGVEYGGVTEYAIACSWVDMITSKLSVSFMVAKGTLKEKCKDINARGCSLAIEIHFNRAVDADGTPIGKGCETLYCPGSEKGKMLAESVHGILSKFYFPDRGIKEGWYRQDKTRGPVFFLSQTKCPSVIIEAEFIHRMDEIRQSEAAFCFELAEFLNNFGDL